MSSKSAKLMGDAAECERLPVSDGEIGEPGRFGRKVEGSKSEVEDWAAPPLDAPKVNAASEKDGTSEFEFDEFGNFATSGAK